MTRVMQKLAGAWAGVALLSLGAAAQAAPFQMATDAQERVWVLDAATGAVSYCQPVAAAGPKVIDLTGGVPETREAPARAASPVCVEARGPMPPEVEWTFGRVGLNGYDDYGMDGLRLRGDSGTWLAWPASEAPLLVRPRMVNVNLY